MKKTLFIGIDFAKANFVASALLDEDPDPVCLPKSFSNDDKGAKALVSWIVKLLPETCSLSDVLVCGEHTGSYSLLLPRRLFDLTPASTAGWRTPSVSRTAPAGSSVRSLTQRTQP